MSAYGGLYNKKKGYQRRYEIASYGVILYCNITPPRSCPNTKPMSSSNIHTPDLRFLLTQRRETYEYMEFMKGNYKNYDYARFLFTRMTKEEKQRLRDYTFDELWEDLWIIRTYRIYRDGRQHAKTKFLKIRKLIPKLIKDTKHEYADHLPWGFPKGRKDVYNEANIDCAFREFKEETGIRNTDHLKIQRGCVPYKEVYSGSNGKLYSTYYYLVESPNLIDIQYRQTNMCIRKTTISSEVLSMEWMTYEDALKVLSTARCNIISAIRRHINRSGMHFRS